MCEPHVFFVVKPYDKEQYDSLQDTQIKVIYITVKEGCLLCNIYMYLFMLLTHIHEYSW